MMLWGYLIDSGITIVVWEGGSWLIRKIFNSPAEYTPSTESITTPSGSPYRTNAFDPVVVQPLISVEAPKPAIMPFAWDYKIHAHTCPKCRWYQKVRGKAIVPKICDCSQYSKEHYHFKCYKCEFKSLMKTADDKDDKEKKG